MGSFYAELYASSNDVSLWKIDYEKSWHVGIKTEKQLLLGQNIYFAYKQNIKMVPQNAELHFVSF